MRKVTTFAILIAFVNVVFAQNFVIDKSQNFKSEITFTEKSLHEKLVNIKLNEYNLTEVNTPKGNAFIINIPEANQLFTKGAPDLPKLNASFAIPYEAQMKYEIIAEKYFDIENIEIAPSKGHIERSIDPQSIPYTYGSAYTKDVFFPQNTITLNEPYYFRDIHGQNIWFNMVKYNPVKKTLRIYTEVTIKYYATGNIYNKSNLKKPSSTFENIYSKHFMNYSSNEKYDIISEEGEMLIIAYDEYADEMTELVKWKNQRGLKTELVKLSQVGTAASHISNYIMDYYNKNNLTFVLLVGDGQHIPSLLKGTGHSDQAYGHIIGSDSYPEVLIGRFSAENKGDVQTQVQKTILYEKDLNHEDIWLGKATGIASDEGGDSGGDDGESDIAHMENIKTDLLNFGYTHVDQVYDPGASASTVSAALNEGRGLINYIGHGSDYSWVTTGFDISRIGNLSNINKLPFIFDVACVNGNFHEQTCFAEAWLRANSMNGLIGAVAMVASTINQSWSSPMDAQDEMIDILTHSYQNNIKRTFGGITANGMAHMIDNYGQDGSNMACTWTVFGDPSLIARNTTPENFELDYQKKIVVGTSDYQITGKTDGSVITISQENEIICTDQIKEGKVVFDLSSLTLPGKIILTAVGQNKTTLIDTLELIVPDGPYIVPNGFVVNDNQNQAADYTESFSLDINLRNVGIETATNVKVDLLCDDEFIETFSDNTEISFENIDASGEKTSQNVFNIKVKDIIPDQHQVNFMLKISADNYDEIWEYKIKLRLNAPKLIIEKFFYNDDFEGNLVNHIIDAGEIGDVVFKVRNIGHSPILNMTNKLALKDPSEYIEFITTESSNDIIEVNQAVDIAFSLNSDENTPLETKIPVSFKINNDILEYNYDTTIIIGREPVFLINEENEIYACTGQFFDSGGEFADYKSSENNDITFYPTESGNVVQMNFTDFDLEDGYDFLFVYNGSSANSENEMDGSPFTGSTIPSEIKAMNPEGALTFRFFSDKYTQKRGWTANLSCKDATGIPENALNPLPANQEEDFSIIGELKWDIVEMAVQYEVYFGTTLPEEPTAIVYQNRYIPEILEPYTNYQWKIVPKNINNEKPKSESPVWSFTTGHTIVTIDKETSNTCDASFYDSGLKENYSNNEDYWLTIYPDTDAKLVSIAFSEFNLESNFDFLEIYDGITAKDKRIGRFDGNNVSSIGNNGSVTSSHPTGALTFRFSSDEAQNYEGWKAKISCTDKNGYDVTFIVKDNNGPLANVDIDLKGYIISTDNDGKATINCVPNTYQFQVEVNNYNKYFGSFVVNNENQNVEITLTITGIEDDIQNEVKLYPNPSNGMVQLKVGNELIGEKIILYNTIGKIVVERSIEGNIENFNLQYLSKGMYIFVINSNKQHIIKKLILE